MKAQQPAQTEQSQAQKADAPEPEVSYAPLAALDAALPPPGDTPGNSAGARTVQRLQHQRALQINRHLGNRALANELQRQRAAATPAPASAVVTRPDDHSEREAEQTAAAIMRQPADQPTPIAAPHASAQATEPISPAVAQQIASLSGGDTLPASERAFFEPRFGQDLGHVRLHTNTSAAQLARALDAQAFTSGHDIVFAPEAPQPGTEAGRELLAHELAHVVQQQAHPAAVQRKLSLDAAVAAAAASISEADVAQEQPEPVEVQPVDLADAPLDSAAGSGDAPDGEAVGSGGGGIEGLGEVQDAGAADPAAADPAAAETTAAAPAAAINPAAAPAAAAPAAAAPAAAAPAAAETVQSEEPPIRRLIQRTPATPTADPAFQAVTTQVRGANAQARAHAPASQKAAEAAAAAEMPAEEKLGKAQDVQTSATAAEATAQAAQASGGNAPGFDKAAFVTAVKAKIDQLTPSDPKEMENIEGSGVFGDVKSAVDEKVQGGKAAAQGNVDDKIAEEPPVAAVPDKPVTALEENNPGAPPAAIAADGAAPKPRSPDEVETPLLEASSSLDGAMESAGVTEEQLANSNEPQFQEALAAKGEAQEAVASDLPTYRASEQGGIDATISAANSATTGTLDGMHETRSQAFGQLDGVQADGKSADEERRAEIGRQIDAIFSSTRTDVEGILESLDSQVDQEFSSGAEAAKQATINYIKAETQKYKDERYKRNAEWYDLGAHVEGAVTHLGDALTDMPPEYYEIYRQGRDEFGRQMESVLIRVADIVADHLERAKARIEQGKQQIAEFVAKQPADLQEVAQQCADDANSKFAELERSVDSHAENLVADLAQRYIEQRDALDAELEQMREADKGLLAKAGDMIGGAIATIKQLGDLLTSVLQGAAGAVQSILKNPIEFLGNLLSAVSQGLQRFVSNIGTHLQQGLIGWLTGAVAEAGITLPAQFDLPGIFSLVMQLLGLTWQNIRAKIVKALGPQGEMIIGALEQAWEIFQIIQSEGIGGLWRFVQDMIGDIKAMVMDQIKTMIAEEVIRAGIDWLIGMLGGPAGAFVKAVQGIIRVVSWFMNNGSRVAALLNAIFQSITSIAAGNIGGAAAFIEQALASAVPTVISFLADLLGLGGVAKKVQGIITSIQAPINKAIDWIVQKAKAMAKKIGKLFGMGGEESDPQDQEKRLHKGVTAGVGAVNRLKGRRITQALINPVLAGIRMRYRLSVLEPFEKEGYWAVRGDIQRMIEKKSTLEVNGTEDVGYPNIERNTSAESLKKLKELLNERKTLNHQGKLKQDFVANIEAFEVSQQNLSEAWNKNNDPRNIDVELFPLIKEEFLRIRSDADTLYEQIHTGLPLKTGKSIEEKVLKPWKHGSITILPRQNINNHQVEVHVDNHGPHVHLDRGAKDQKYIVFKESVADAEKEFPGALRGNARIQGALERALARWKQETE
jgi:hypothetical protein